MAASRLVVAVSCVLVAFSVSLQSRGQEQAVPETTEELVDQLVASALKSELEGDANERTRLLDQAQLVGPNVPLVNWLSGRVSAGGEWLAVKDVQKEAADDPRFAEYRKLRAALDGTARSERVLARWCGRNGWSDAERFHYARLLLYPDLSEAGREEALRKLNLRLLDGGLFTPEEAVAHEAQKKSKQEAFDLWRPKIVAWRKAAHGTNVDAAAEALTELRGVSDPQVILAAEASLYDSSEAFAIELLSLLGKFREFEATEALVRFALLTDSEPCVKTAVQQLKPRPIHDFYPQLMVLLQAPVRSEFRVSTLGSSIRYEHVVSQQGPKQNLVAKKVKDFHATKVDARHIDNQHGTETWLRQKKSGPYKRQVSQEITTNEELQDVLRRPGAELTSPITRTYEEYLSVMESFLTALNVERRISSINANLALKNERVFHLLEETSPRVYPRNPTVWWGWWQEYNQRRVYTPTQYLYSHIASSYAQYLPIRVTTTTEQDLVYPSCFLAGTKVQTQTGPQAIETILPGDRVLSRNVDSGELEFKVVYATTLREPSPVLQLRISGEEILATKGHPFWVAGKGWVMAKELVPGDVLHTLAGPSKLQSTKDLPEPQPAHNLVVADFNTYFVGDSGVLAHDNTWWKPTPVRVPGEKAAAR